MMNISQPYTGHYFKAEWLQYNDETELYEVPIIIRFRTQNQEDTVREDTLAQEQGGREVIKSSFAIQVLENYKYKPKDKIRVINEDKKYTVLRVGKGYNSVNTMASLMFPKIENRPNVLYLGIG